MALDLNALWDFNAPAASEERFRAAIVRAAPDDAFILQTQIARTWGLRGDFARAREILGAIEPGFASASPEARTRWLLESGRTWVSAAHKQEERTSDAKQRAEAFYSRAFETAKAAGLDGLALDALHMMALVDDAPDRQLAWNLQAIEFMEASVQPAAKRWAGALYNNAGHALHLAGRDDEAIALYRKSQGAYESEGRLANAWIARWMIANALRTQGRLDEALAIQLALEQERDARQQPSAHVYAELEQIYLALGDRASAAGYAAKRAALKPE